MRFCFTCVKLLLNMKEQVPGVARGAPLSTTIFLHEQAVKAQARLSACAAAS